MGILSAKKPYNNPERVEKLVKNIKNKDCVKFNMNIPRYVHEQFKTKAIKDRKDMSEILLDYIMKYIRNSR